MKSKMRLALVVITTMLIASCGGGSGPTQRTRNAALPTRTALPYSCAQLNTTQATVETTEIRFTLCDAAEMYSIVTPDGVNGTINDTEVQGGEEVAVPVASEVNGPATKLIVKTNAAVVDENSIYHSGIHIYDVSLASATEELVGAGNDLVGSVYPQVVYDMPTPQPWTTYRSGFTNVAGERERYISYVEEFIEKWAMVKLTTCHSTLADAVMADIDNPPDALAEAQMKAKQFRDRDWFISLNSLRFFVAMGAQTPSLCASTSTGFNVFVQGIEKGYKPVELIEVSKTKDPVALLKSYALLQYWSQVMRGECAATQGVKVDSNGGDIDAWSDQIIEQLTLLTEDTNLTSAERIVATRALRQADVLHLWKNMRTSADGDNSCADISAGYAVAVQQSVEQQIENVNGSLAPAVETQSQSPATAPESLAEIVVSPAPEVSLAPAQLAWPEATTAAKSTFRIGQTVSRGQVVAQSGLLVTSKSTVKLVQVTSSKKVCTVKSWGVKAIKVGTCRVGVSVATKGKKTQTKTVSLIVAK